RSSPTCALLAQRNGSSQRQILLCISVRRGSKHDAGRYPTKNKTDPRFSRTRLGRVDCSPLRLVSVSFVGARSPIAAKTSFTFAGSDFWDVDLVQSRLRRRLANCAWPCSTRPDSGFVFCSG